MATSPNMPPPWPNRRPPPPLFSSPAAARFSSHGPQQDSLLSTANGVRNGSPAPQFSTPPGPPVFSSPVRPVTVPFRASPVSSQPVAFSLASSLVAMILKPSSAVVLLLQALYYMLPLASAGHDYGQALSKSILFYEAQRLGYLSSNQRVKWRTGSGLHDGKASGIDLVGGYYDAGDNVKFGIPMAFTVTMMSWSIIEYGRQLAASGELGHAMEAVKWGTDYFIKAHPEPNVLYGEVGDGFSDHYCWQRPKDMTTDCHAYGVDANKPGSDLAGETAAVMAASSIIFHRSNPAYSSELLSHAK